MLFPLSHDGVPFLMHDNTLRRTTDVEKLFPERVGQDSSMFNWTDLQALNAGQWFLKVSSAVETKPTVWASGLHCTVKTSIDSLYSMHIDFIIL